jgi:hypothetical protein
MYAHAGLNMIRDEREGAVADAHVRIDAADAGHDERLPIVADVVEPEVQRCGRGFTGYGRDHKSGTVDAKAHDTAYLEANSSADS